ncbi:hypothetical protein ACHWQZ_G014663 [Mnemiopsis leidyi]
MILKTWCRTFLLFAVSGLLYSVSAIKCLHCSDVLDNEERVLDKKMWRTDGRCGPGFYLNNTNIIAECNPDLGNECCSPDGWCGSSTKHCCLECVKYSRSFGDFDLPKCRRTTITECSAEKDVCVEVKIATNTTIQHIDRYVTVRKCGARDNDLCDKYVTAGHTCISARQCDDEDLCNRAGRAAWALFLIVLLLYVS